MNSRLSTPFSRRCALRGVAHRSRGRRRGQALVEFAFVVTVLLTLTMGLMQYGLLFNTASSLTNIAREGARYSAVHATEANSDPAIRTYVRTVAAKFGIPATALPDSRIVIEMVNGSNGLPAARSSGNPIRVRVIYDMRQRFFLPYSGKNAFPGLAQFDDTYESSATMVLE